MATFNWKTLTVYVGEMSRAEALAFSKQAEMIQLLQDAEALAREIDFMISGFSPSRVLHNNAALGDGDHTIAIGEGEYIKLTLPLTRACFDALPVSLAAAWTKAAEAENQLVTDFFLNALKTLSQRISAPQFDNAPS